MRIASDLDGVIVDLVPGLFEFFAFRLKKNIPRQLTSYKPLRDYFNISKEQEDDLLFEFFNSKHFTTIPAMKGAVDSIKRIAKSHEIFIVTSRPKFTAEQTRDWFNNLTGFCPPLFFSSNRNMQTKGKEKYEICREQNVDLMIEDEPFYALSCAENRIPVLLYHSDYNIHIKHKNISRVYSWDDISKRIALFPNL